MSGFEVAGIVLGAIPLVISALEHYKSGRSMLAAMSKSEGQIDRLLCQLKNQKIQFYFDILQLLRSAEVEEAEETDISLEECQLILQNAKNGKLLQEYLGILFDDFLDTLSRYERCLKKIVKKLKHIKRLPDAAKDDLASLIAANPAVKGRFVFAQRISFSIEKESLNALVEELAEDRLNLKMIIKGMKTEKEHCAKAPTHEARKLSRILAQVSASAKSLYVALCQTCACACQKDHKFFLELHNRMPRATPTRSRKRSEALEFNLVLETDKCFREAHVTTSPHDQNTTCATIVAQDPNKKQVSFQGPIKSGPTIVITSTGQSPTIAAKPQGICDLVSQTRLQDCVINLKLQGELLDLGHEAHQFQRDLSTPTTLNAVLRQGAAKKKLQITPKQRTLLALNIASSIIQLRQTSWSYPALDSNVVKCMLGANGHNARASTIAFIEQAAETGSRVISTGSEPKSALLELVILLLEIWHHETIEMWAAEFGFGDTHTSRQRIAAAKAWLDDAAEEMPPLYMGAAQACYDFCKNSSQDWDDADFLRLYCENVVRPLQKNCETWGVQP